jgi:hypothetical protein
VSPPLKNHSFLREFGSKIFPWSESNSRNTGSVGKGFGLEVESEAICQRGNIFDCIRTGVLPHRAELRALDEFAEKMAVFLMDNVSSHITSDGIGLVTEG